MKLKVRQTGVVSKELDVNIRNPNATVGNMRAAVAILFKLEPHSFRMVHDACDLEDDKKLLSATGVQEMDLVQLVAKRPRDESIVPETTHQQAAAEQTQQERPTVAAPSTASGVLSEPPRATAPHTLPSRSSCGGDEDPFLAQRLRADEHINANRDDVDDAEGDDDLEEAEEGGEADERDAEIGEMISLLLSAPNLLDMRSQFLQNPQQVLAQIQSTSPRLFQLIARHNEAFLEMVSNETLLQALHEEQEFENEEAYIGEEDEEMDSEDEAEIHQMLLAALAEDAVDHDLEGDDEHSVRTTAGGSAATSVTLGRNATQLMESIRSTLRTTSGGNSAATSRAGTTVATTAVSASEEGANGTPLHDDASSAAIASGGPRRHSSTGAGASSSNGMRIPEVISEDDNKKIEDLMQLGFTKDQCTAAFYRCNRSVERAANMLFEGMSQL